MSPEQDWPGIADRVEAVRPPYFIPAIDTRIWPSPAPALLKLVGQMPSQAQFRRSLYLTEPSEQAIIIPELHILSGKTSAAINRRSMLAPAAAAVPCPKRLQGFIGIGSAGIPKPHCRQPVCQSYRQTATIVISDGEVGWKCYISGGCGSIETERNAKRKVRSPSGRQSASRVAASPQSDRALVWLIGVLLFAGLLNGRHTGSGKLCDGRAGGWSCEV
ncbi:hypothetical protein B0T17DRAFT_504507 [Bombardia bombarda]|uniref:Uncharacterized protein n=1 Tax=Bombardia bombarda TaxID=252184 RepID=A0AA40CH76_9PEZI|nr:hypothetical protein B0T17DRAFT_504507 [Bombardia bombarda]